MTSIMSLHRSLYSNLTILALALCFVGSSPLVAADLYGARVILSASESAAVSVVPPGEARGRSPEAVVRPGAFPGLDRVLWDNGTTDAVDGYSNLVAAVFGFRRTVLDDFVVPAGGLEAKRFDWLHSWDSGGAGLGTGVEVFIYDNDPNGGGTGVDGPGRLRETAVVTGFGEAITGQVFFGRAVVWSWANLQTITLPAGRYWIEWTIIGPENNFVWAQSLPRDNQAWINYEDFAGLEPSEGVFTEQRDLAWALSSHHQYSVAYASLGGSNDGADDPGAVFIIDANSGASRYVGTPMPGRGLPGLAVDSNNRLFAVTDNAGGTSTAKLLQLNPRDATVVREIGDLMLGATPEALSDLAIQPGTDVLFGVETLNGAVQRNNLVTVNTGTAAVTSVGIDPAIVAVNGFIAIAFGPNGTLWAKSSNGTELFTLDPSTAAVLTTSSITPAGVGSIGLGVRPMNGQLFMSECCNFTDGNDIYSLDTTTNDAAFLGSFGGDRRVHDFAFVFYIFVDPLESMDLSAWALAVP